MKLTVTNHTSSTIAIGGGRVGSLTAAAVGIYELTTAELEAVRDRLVALESAGMISWSTGPSVDAEDDDAEGATVGYVNALAGFSSQSVSVYVATGGDDTNGDGTRGNPYATIARALRDRRSFSVNGVAFRVQVVAPYTGPGFAYEEVRPMIAETTADDAWVPSSISVESFYDSALAGVDDPRFVIEVGPITSSATANVNTMVVTYTVPTGSFTTAHIGKVIRVFRGGAEIGRGTLASIAVGASDIVYIQQARTSGPTASWAPAPGDILYACEYAVVLNSPVRIGCGQRNQFVLAGLKVQFTGNDFDSNAISITSGTVRLAGIRTMANDTWYGLEIQSPAHVESRYIPSTVVPWMDATERTFLFMSGGYSANGGASTQYASFITGEAMLAGFVLANKTIVTHRGMIYTYGLGFRGQLLVINGAKIDTFSAPVTFYGNRATPNTQPPMWLDGAVVGNDASSSLTVVVDTAGYSAGLTMCNVKRSMFTARLVFNGIGGAAAITAPVMIVDVFSHAQIAAGNITGPVGQDIRAGSTNAAFAGLPLVEAATLTRISSS
jgi:hypothetical protein